MSETQISNLVAAELETEGTEWAKRSDAFLVGYVSLNRGVQFHTPAIVEMQRRQTVATREFNTQATEQADTMIGLTRWIMALTIVLGVIAVLQLIAAVWPKGAS
jgi:hypothetical protein